MKVFGAQTFIPAWIGFLGAIVAAIISAIFSHLINRKWQKDRLDRFLNHQDELFQENWRRRFDLIEREFNQKLQLPIYKRVSEDLANETRYLDWLINYCDRIPVHGSFISESVIELFLENIYEPINAECHTEFDDTIEKSENRKKRFPHLYTVEKALTFIDGKEYTGLFVKGAPGDGKTTIIKHLALTYARSLQESNDIEKSQRVPILVNLQSIAKMDLHAPIANVLSDYFRKRGCQISENFLQAIIENKRCIILLDGLDEILNESERIQVFEWIKRIQDFCKYIPIIITCRTTGFRKHFWLPKFLCLELKGFTNINIESYAEKWSKAIIVKGRSQEWNDTLAKDLVRAIKANHRVLELASNPLMMSIISSIYFQFKNLPERRVDLYDQCVAILLQYWDEAKGIAPLLPVDISRKVMQTLAFEMFISGQPIQIHRSDLEPIIAKNFQDQGITILRVNDFLDGIRDRSGLLVELAPDIFGFRHKTFQEYLVAVQIAETKNDKLLCSQLENVNWREVLLLRAGYGDASNFLNSLICLSDKKLINQLELISCIDEEIYLVSDEKIQENWSGKFSLMLRCVEDPLKAVNLALYLRDQKKTVDEIIEAFDQAENSVAKGQLALLLCETHDDKAIEYLKSHLTDNDIHVRYMCALALECLDIDCHSMLDILMTEIRTGEFIMGSKLATESGSPRKVKTNGFLISRFPVTNLQYGKFIKANGYAESRCWSEKGSQWKIKSGRTSIPHYWNDINFGKIKSAPVVGISYYEASAFAEWSGMRLPSEIEWERAARGDNDDRAFPWGDTFDDTKCYLNKFRHPIPVGSTPYNISPHGCYDMSGNISEWTKTPYTTPELNTDDECFVIRGGTWDEHEKSMMCSARHGQMASERLKILGFRLCKDI